MIRRNVLLASADGRRLLAAQLLDALGAGVSQVALPWLVLDRGGGPALAGLVFAAGTVPYVVFGLLAGVAGDRLPRRRLMLVAHLVEALAALLVPAVALLARPSPWLALLAAFALGSGRVFADAGTFGAIADLVGPDRFVEGQAALTTAWAGGFVAGPFLAGLAVSRVGAVGALVGQAAAFVIAAYLVFCIRRPLHAPTQDPDEAVLQAMKAGLDVIRHHPLLRLLTLVAFLWNLSVVGADALIVPFLRHAVGLNGAQAGWVLGAGGLAGLLSAPVVSGVTTRYGGLRLLSGCILMSGVAILLLAFAPDLWLALAGNVLLALSGFTATTAFIGERQKLAPPHLQARVGITGRMLALGTVTAAGLIASALASAVALRPLFVAFGLAAFCVAAWAAPALSRAEAARTEPACGAAG